MGKKLRSQRGKRGSSPLWSTNDPFVYWLGYVAFRREKGVRFPYGSPLINILMRFHEIITEGRDASLFHGFKTLKYALVALKNNEMLGTTTQRWWPNGIEQVPENDPRYRGQSYWMKGISLTRDVKYAASWGDVVFELDQSLLVHNYKIVPFNWMRSHVPTKWDDQASTIHYRKGEREEFLILEKDPNSYKLPPEEWTEFSDNLDMKAFRAPASKKLAPLSRYLKAVYIEKTFYDKFPDRDYEEIKAHPKFAGFLTKPPR